MSATFDLFLFSIDPAFIRTAVAGGVAGIIVDCERCGKAARQQDADTQINEDTIEDLRAVRACTESRVICRVNPCGEWTIEEIEQVQDAGADEILLPMVRTVAEVERVLDLVGSRCGVGVMLETHEAISLAPELGRLPLARAYVGLIDLAIDTSAQNLFTVLADGTIDRIRDAWEVPFGFGGLTLPHRGSPIRCRLVMGELARLRAGFSVLRRSFYADVAGLDTAVEVPRIQTAMLAAFGRAPDIVQQEHEELCAAVSAWNPRLQPSGRLL